MARQTVPSPQVATFCNMEFGPADLYAFRRRLAQPHLLKQEQQSGDHENKPGEEHIADAKLGKVKS